ncbi:TonB-dependent receptor [Novosphingopyxis sp.]|uniref:TonB-dependent receptor n=1 Tax=Novosphingopyxis sp. TaxID=2709690 RepID=UPI003B5C6335
MKKRLFASTETAIVALTFSVLPFSYAQAQQVAQEVSPQQTVSNPSEGEQTEDQSETSDGIADIVVTARRREESLLSVPVAVTAFGADELQRYDTDTLEKVGELTPGVVIGQTKSSAGGSIAVRGISTSAATVGFEQSVLVNIDGVPVSNGRIVALGFFDLQRVEVLKGPQALLFGKNNSAGVISLVSADPTDTLEGYAKVGYEFVADEAVAEGAISGPMTENLGIRLAVRARNMEGWIYNDARAGPNPFAPSLPLAEPDHRLGDSEFSGRITLKYEPTNNFDVTLKLLGSHNEDDGFGVSNQVIGGCLNGQPRIRGIVDPYGECERDNHTSAGLPNATIIQNGPDPRGPHGRLDAVITSLNANYAFGPLTLTSTTGYLYLDGEAAGTGEISGFAQLFGSEPQTINSFSQELRVLSDFDSPINFMVGGFYQDLDFDYAQNVKLGDAINFNPATGLYIAWLRPGYTYGKTYSAFAQLIYNPIPEIEIAGGARYTKETKDSFSINTYAFLTGFPQGKSLSDHFEDSNISPEVSVSYHPTPDSTIYAAYKTGFKSGGFALSGTIQTATRASDLAFDSETARGFEIGAKGRILQNRLQLEATAYRYIYSDLQVNSYNPATVSYTFSNAASLKQTGIDLQALYEASDYLLLRAAVNYNRNRFGEYFGQCYGLQTAAQGCNIFPGPSQDFTGRVPARSPDWAGNAGASLNIPASDSLSINLTGDVFYTDGYFGSETLAPSTYQPSFWRFNSAIRLRPENERWELGLIGRNLSNRYYLLTAQDKSNQPGDQRGTVARGREIMVQGLIRF